MTDYMKYRGNCKEMSESLVADNPSLTLVRGFYICPIWGEEQHWWTKTTDGEIIDVTSAQFPSNGKGEYVEFDGMLQCSQCDKQIAENDINKSHGSYAFCSYECYGKFIGL